MQRESRLIAQSNATKKQAQNLECLSKIMQVSWKRFEGRSQQKVAFAQWRMFLQNSRLAESAFEQMMELHQKHALQRFETASNLIWKINIRYSYRTTLEKLINTAIGTDMPIVVQDGGVDVGVISRPDILRTVIEGTEMS